MERYVRVKKIGEGSFGKALLVKKRNDGKHYVIKEINICRMKPREREESRKEVKVLSQLKHPNIVSYQESFEESGNLYIVMDYCDGGDLYKKINGQRGIAFSEDQVMDWFVQICLGLKHVHDRKILHRDIKSQNIFLTRHGIIKMGDFGIARVLHSTVELARTCIGTPYYLSPEIVENRPYNNKSDIWSLGCVLYEMLTLKHAFEAGNMKNLVLKIIRGSYPPIPLRYSADIRMLVAQLLKRNPHDRPSVNTVLKKNFIQKRIEKFLSKEVIEDEFSHTVLHRKPFGMPPQRAVPHPRPAPKPSAPPQRYSDPKAKYGVSVAKKKPTKKPGSGGEAAAKKAVKPAEPGRAGSDKNKEDARERRRKELMQNEDQKYQDHMKKVQQQRWERQQRDQINRAREQAWKNTLSVGLSPDKNAAKKNSDPGPKPAKAEIVYKQPQAMQKYQVPSNRPVSAYEQKENIPVGENKQRPVSANNAPTPAWQPPRPMPAWAPPNPAWEAARQGEINRAQGANAAELARIKEEFWSNKRAAQMNKRRAQANWGGYEYKPPVQQHEAKPANGNGEKGQEKDYLSRLEAIRRQNYHERQEIQRRMAGIRGAIQEAPEKPKEVKVAGDPRYDPDARQKKIAALKAQAEDRAAMLRKQLEARKAEVLARLNREGKEKAEEERQRQIAELRQQKPREFNRPAERPIRPAPREEKPAVAPIGLETALKQVGVTTLFRSNSEGDLSSLVKEKKEEEEQGEENAPRKQWGAIPFKPRMLPLEVTASHMEATSAADAVIKPGEDANHVRKQWGQPQRTQIVSALENVKLQTATSAFGVGGDEMDAAKSPPVLSAIGKTITVSKGSQSPGMGVTTTVKSIDSPTLGVTVVKNAASPKTLVPAVSEEKEAPKDGDNEPASQQKPPGSPATAWGEAKKPETPKKATSPREEKAGSREAYEDYLKSLREKEEEEEKEMESDEKPKESDQQTPGQEKEPSPVQQKDSEIVDLEDVEESSFHTADGSPNRSVYSTMLRTGNFDTDSRRLRTCSMPDLRFLFQTASPLARPSYMVQQSTDEADDENDVDVDDDDDGDDNDNNQDDDDDDENEDENNDEEGEDDEFGDDEESELGNESDGEEDVQEYENMLESMRDVLVSSARSPSPMKSVRPLPTGTAQSMEWDPIADTASPTRDESDGPQDGRSSELSNLNEDWDSGEGEEDEEGGNKSEEEEDDSVFQRLEESRMALERELGFDKFLRVYKYLQAVQENEDDNADVGSTSEITELLGDKEHLYPKILYLVIADSAYTEDNQ
ncbi:serine/threonine-protein kinase Nek1 isoform X2 [Nematostella vectensis]|uniref:serine/threonine-protein kinase Nek1 isoform X2 n=1 Tax=Nematostella vectensis TaxID=45351 RepID=UPI00207748EF|nr:serine/threonine-protein kinase Nek1 isoform X2 [Nematostella vectensis]